MILAKKGKLSVAQAIDYNAAEISENVIGIGTLEDTPENTFLDIETAVKASGSGALTIDLVVANEAALTTNVVVLRVVIAAETDKRILTAGAHVLGCSLPREVKELADQLGYDYLGLIYTADSSLAVSFNANIGPSHPRSRDKAQIVDSNVSVPSSL
jgi:hypothetical protein